MKAVPPVVGVVTTGFEGAIGAHPWVIVVTAMIYVLVVTICSAVEYRWGAEARAVRTAMALVKGGFTRAQATNITTEVVIQLERRKRRPRRREPRAG